MKGMDGIWYWMWTGIGSWRGYLRPTLDYWPAIEDLAQEINVERKRICHGKVLSCASMKSSPAPLAGTLTPRAAAR